MEHEKLLRIREAIVSFFKLHEQEPTSENYSAWLQTLDKIQRHQVQKLPFDHGRQLISFRTYWIEQKGYSISEFLRSQLSTEDYEYLMRIGTSFSEQVS